MADTVFDEYLTQLARKETAQTAAGTVLSKDDPDATAESLRVGAELGVPASVVAVRPDAFKDDLAQKKATQALEGAPKVSAWLRDPVNGALAKDDLDNLSWFEKRQSVKGFKTGVTGMKQMGAAAATIPVGAIKSTGMKRLELFKQAEGLDPNLEPFEIAEALGIDPMTPSASMVADYVKGDAARRQRHINRSIGMVDSSDETLQSLIGAVKQYSKEMEKTQGRVPNFTDISDVKDFGDWFAYNSGQSIPFLATVLASGLVAGPAGAVAAGYGMGVGDIQAGLIEEGVEDRGGLALAGGLPYAALERLGPAGAPFRRIGKEVIEEVAKGYFKRLGRELPKQMVEEFINEAGQEIIKDIAVGEGTGEGVTLDNEQLLAWFNSGMAGAAGAITFTPASTAVEMRLERRIKEAENAGSAKQALEEVDEMAANSKLKARAPDKFAEVLAQADVSEVYIPTEGLRELFQAKDVPLDDETLAAWGINPSDFEQQSQVDGMVAVPTSAYSAKISGTDDAQWFKDNATLDPMELTSTEAAQFNEQFQDVLADAFEQAEAEERQALEYRSAETQVYDAMFSQLRAAGQTVDVAEKNALLFKSFIATQAQREGEDAVDVARRFGVQVRGPEQQTNRRRGQIDVMLNTLRKNTNKALKPQGRDLLQFIIDEGGLADVGGDIAALDAPKGLIGETFEQIAERLSQPNLDGSAAQSVAMGLDEMARRAIEAGYFPELLGGNDINADGTVIDEAAVLLDAVTRAISGEGIYLDGEGVNPDYQALSDELSRRGVDLSEMTNDEVVALLEQDGQEYNQSGELVTDSDAFKEWFGDSQVVDENGAPLVVYHGTPVDTDILTHGNQNWRKHISPEDSAAIPDPVFFSGNPDVANSYSGRRSYDFDNDGIVYPVYLAMQNPLVVDMQGRKMGNEARDLPKEALASGYDGVVFENVVDDYHMKLEPGTIYVTLSPTQIKSVHNRGTFDGSDPRILYQKDDGSDRPLAVAHNISAEGLQIADELGGLAAPSLAVIRADIGPLDGFGEITLVGGSDLANPKNSGVRAFNADVYSVRQPRALTAISKKDQSKIEEKLDEAARELGKSYYTLDVNDFENYGLTHLADQPEAMLAFLRAKGVAYRVPMEKKPSVPAKLKKIVSGIPYDVRQDPKMMAAITEHFQQKQDEIDAKFPDRKRRIYIEDDGTVNINMLNRLVSDIERAKAPAKPDFFAAREALRKKIRASKKREAEFMEWVEDEFADLTGAKFFENASGKRVSYDMDNVVRFMRGKVRDEEGFNYGVGNIRSNMAREFKSISSVKDARDDIVTAKEFDAVKDEVAKEFDNLIERLAPLHSHGDTFGFYNTAAEFIGDVAKGKTGQWRGEFKDGIPDDLIGDIRSFLNKLKVLPTEYFEVKMQRAVDFSEFETALVPKNATKETIATLKKHGLKIKRYDSRTAGGRAEALKSVSKRIFFQGEQSPRGSIVFPAGGVENGQTIINLMETANLSTFLHEFGHYTLEVFNVLASDPDASDGMKADLAAIHKFLDGDITKTESHEKWARAFEQYLMEGKAPSLELATAFARFKSWLTRIYKTARGLSVKLTPEIREVMDRLIATDEQIAEARDAAEMAPLFKSAPAGMSKQAYETYRKTAQRAAEQGEERLIKRTMEKVRREKEKWYKAERAEVRKEVSAAISSRPEYRLIEVMANKVWVGKDVQVPDIQLDRAELAEAFGDGIFTELSRSKIGGKRAIYKAGGISLSEAAEFFGFESPVKMVDALQNAGKRKDAIEVETDRVMLDRYGDPLNDGTIEQEALEAVHTEQQAQSIVAEARYFADRAGASTKNMTARVYRQRAKLMLGRMTVGQAMKPDTFLAAERRAARGAEEAFARIIKGKDPEAALAAASRHKEHQLLNHYLYLESRDFSKKLASKRTKMQAYNKKSVRAKLEGGYIEQIDAILEQYDFRVRSAGQVARSESLRDFVARMEEEGRAGELAIDERLVEQAGKVHYTKLTMDELLGLFDTIDNIDHLGRYKQKLIDAKEKRDLEEIASMVGSQMDKNVKGAPPGRTETGGERRRRLGRDFLNTTLNADTLLREIDGFEDIGPVWNAMKAKIDEGMNNLVERREGVAKSFDEIYSVYSGKEKRDMNKKVLIEPLGETLNRWELISLALNTGNEANFERLTNPKAKGAFTAKQVNDALALLDDRDWKVVQSLWDYIDGFWPEIAAKEKRQTGTTPKKVAAQQMANAPDFVRGGYYPIRYDARLSGLTDDFQQKELADSLMGGKFGKAQTRNGHTKERTTTTKQPIMLDLGVAHNHVEQVLYDIELGEAVNGTWKILQKTKPLFFEKGKQSDFNALELWVQDVASGESIAAEGFYRVMRHIRTGFTVSRLALNVSTALIQPSGLVQSAVVVGKKAVAKGTVSYFSNPKRWTEDVLEVSPMMRERKKTFERDVFNVVGDLEGGPVTGRWEKFQRDVILPASFWMMQTVQFHAVDMPTWVAAYEKEIALSGDESKARVYADTMVKRAQGSGLMSDRGMFERGTMGKNLRQHEATKMLTALGSYMFAKGNVAYEQTMKTDFKNPVEVMSLAVDVALLFTLEAVLYSAVKGFLPGEDEDWATWLAMETAFSAFSTLPFFRELSGSMQGFGGGGIYGATVEALARPAIQIGQGEADKALVNSMTDFLGVTMHLPSSQTKAVVNTFFEDDLSLKNDPNPLGALGVGAGGRSLADILLDN